MLLKNPERNNCTSRLAHLERIVVRVAADVFETDQAAFIAAATTPAAWTWRVEVDEPQCFRRPVFGGEDRGRGVEAESREENGARHQARMDGARHGQRDTLRVTRPGALADGGEERAWLCSSSVG